MRSALHSLGVIAVLAATGCAHTPPAVAPPPRAEVVWPEPPAVARVRLATVLPDPGAPPPRRAWWRVALEWLAGAGNGERSEASLPRPFGIALAQDGSVIVADPDGGRVLAFSTSHSRSDVTCAGKPWSAPMAVATAPDGAIYVADAGAAAVLRWSQGRCDSVGAGALERPTGIAVHGDRIWVADPPRHQVVVFAPDGTLVARIGERGEGVGRFNFPSAVAATEEGVLVVDALNFRIVRLDRDGRWVGAFGKAGQGDGEFVLPKAVAAGADGRVYVTDAQRDQVLVFTPDWRFEYAIGTTGTEAGRFTHPAGVAVGAGRIAVADSHNGRVELFEIVGDPS